VPVIRTLLALWLGGLSLRRVPPAATRGVVAVR
jgi:hypothetical protein